MHEESVKSPVKSRGSSLNHSSSAQSPTRAVAGLTGGGATPARIQSGDTAAIFYTPRMRNKAVSLTMGKIHQ